MIKILAIDDTNDVLEALELLIHTYMQERSIDQSEYEILLQNNPEEAIEVIEKVAPDIIFLDIMMPEISGFDILQFIRKNSNIDPQPAVIMSTALGDKETKLKEKELKANAYMLKPFDYRVVSIILDKYCNFNNIQSQNQTQEIFEFDFDDFDSLDEIEYNEEDMQAFNSTHKKVSATEFLKNYDSSEIDTEELLEIEQELNKLIYQLEKNNLEDVKDNIIEIFEKYQMFLNLFSEFDEIYNVLVNFILLLKSNNLQNLEEEQYIKGFIIALITDLIDWEQHVFIETDAQDIFYMNASILNSYIQLKNLIQKD